MSSSFRGFEAYAAGHTAHLVAQARAADIAATLVLWSARHIPVYTGNNDDIHRLLKGLQKSAWVTKRKHLLTAEDTLRAASFDDMFDATPALTGILSSFALLGPEPADRVAALAGIRCIAQAIGARVVHQFHHVMPAVLACSADPYPEVAAAAGAILNVMLVPETRRAALDACASLYMPALLSLLREDAASLGAALAAEDDSEAAASGRACRVHASAWRVLGALLSSASKSGGVGPGASYDGSGYESEDVASTGSDELTSAVGTSAIVSGVLHEIKSAPGALWAGFSSSNPAEQAACCELARALASRYIEEDAGVDVDWEAVESALPSLQAGVASLRRLPAALSHAQANAVAAFAQAGDVIAQASAAALQPVGATLGFTSKACAAGWKFIASSGSAGTGAAFASVLSVLAQDTAHDASTALVKSLLPALWTGVVDAAGNPALGLAGSYSDAHTVAPRGSVQDFEAMLQLCIDLPEAVLSVQIGSVVRSLVGNVLPVLDVESQQGVWQVLVAALPHADIVSGMLEGLQCWERGLADAARAASVCQAVAAASELVGSELPGQDAGKLAAALTLLKQLAATAAVQLLTSQQSSHGHRAAMAELLRAAVDPGALQSALQDRWQLTGATIAGAVDQAAAALALGVSAQLICEVMAQFQLGLGLRDMLSLPGALQSASFPAECFELVMSSVEARIAEWSLDQSVFAELPAAAPERLVDAVLLHDARACLSGQLDGAASQALVQHWAQQPTLQAWELAGLAAATVLQGAQHGNSGAHVFPVAAAVPSYVVEGADALLAEAACWTGAAGPGWVALSQAIAHAQAGADIPALDAAALRLAMLYIPWHALALHTVSAVGADILVEAMPGTMPAISTHQADADPARTSAAILAHAWVHGVDCAPIAAAISCQIAETWPKQLSEALQPEHTTQATWALLAATSWALHGSAQWRTVESCWRQACFAVVPGALPAVAKPTSACPGSTASIQALLWAGVECNAVAGLAVAAQAVPVAVLDNLAEPALCERVARAGSWAMWARAVAQCARAGHTLSAEAASTAAALFVPGMDSLAFTEAVEVAYILQRAGQVVPLQPAEEWTWVDAALAQAEPRQEHVRSALSMALSGAADEAPELKVEWACAAGFWLANQASALAPADAVAVWQAAIRLCTAKVPALRTAGAHALVTSAALLPMSEEGQLPDACADVVQTILAAAGSKASWTIGSATLLAVVLESSRLARHVPAVSAALLDAVAPAGSASNALRAAIPRLLAWCAPMQPGSPVPTAAASETSAYTLRDDGVWQFGMHSAPAAGTWASHLHGLQASALPEPALDGHWSGMHLAVAIFVSASAGAPSRVAAWRTVASGAQAGMAEQVWSVAVAEPVLAHAFTGVAASQDAHTSGCLPVLPNVRAMLQAGVSRTERHEARALGEGVVELGMGSGSGEGTFKVILRPDARAVHATYVMDEMKLALSIMLPATFPLRKPVIQSGQVVGVDTATWKRWVLNLSSLLVKRDDSMVKALETWRGNVQAAFEGVEPCPICYSVLHDSTGRIPASACAVCSAVFHAPCLYKWFSSSNDAKCPMCRSAWEG